MQIHSLLIFFDRIHVFYPVRQQASQQGSQRNKNVFQQNKKQYYNVEKPVREQDKTFLFH